SRYKEELRFLPLAAARGRKRRNLDEYLHSCALRAYRWRPRRLHWRQYLALRRGGSAARTAGRTGACPHWADGRLGERCGWWSTPACRRWALYGADYLGLEDRLD